MTGTPLSAAARTFGIGLSLAFCIGLAVVYLAFEPIPYWKVQAVLLGVPVLAAVALAATFPFLIYDGHLSVTGNRCRADLIAQGISRFAAGAPAPNSIACD